MKVDNPMTAVFPTELAANLWTGNASPVAALNGDSPKWGLKQRMEKVGQVLAAAEPLDRRNWRHPQVGWGLVLPDDDTLPFAARATAGDAPEPIQTLVAARGDAPVLRYRAELGARFVRRYFVDGTMQTIAISSAGERGIAPAALPYYLLIYAPPSVIPWRFQYLLNQPCFVGRLTIEGVELENYINALLKDWADAGCDPHRPVVWTVDHGKDDITTLMRQSIAERVASRLAADNDIGGGLRLLAGSQASCGALLDAVVQQRPALIVTTSHGQTGPIDDPVQMAANLGLLVDVQNQPLEIDALHAVWQPDGAIWYAHACCSAGSDQRNSYKGLVPVGSLLDQVLDAVAGLGAQVAPLPQRLLGAAQPLRAFIGHVEPTFDWTLREPWSMQILTETTVAALYNRMHRAQPEPVGMALNPGYRVAGELFQQWQQLTGEFASAPAERREFIRLMTASAQLAALDRQSLVILGDPTAALPAL
jgi:hypothetical protein